MDNKIGLIKKDNSYYLPEGKMGQPLRLIQLPQNQVDFVKKLYGLPQDVNPAFVISLGGRPYIIKEGLVDLAHRRKIKEIISREVKIMKCRDRGCVRQIQRGYKDNQGNIYENHSEVPHELWKNKKVFKNMVDLPPEENEFCFIYGTEVIMQNKNRYYAEADACPHNTTSMVRNSLARMAQTRSTNIALGRALNIALTSAEELPNVGVNFETGEVTLDKEKSDIGSDRKILLKTINNLREKLGLEKQELSEIVKEQYKTSDPFKLNSEQLEDLRDYLEVKIHNLEDESKEEKEEAEKIEEDFLRQEGMDFEEEGDDN